VADPQTSFRCDLVLGQPPAESVIDSLRERFDDVSIGDHETHMVVLGVDQSAVRALLTYLWNLGMSIHSMTWSRQT
jgi:hypothetical protein